MITQKPVVMTFAGSDPTGGAGVQADIETLASLGCHACTVVTAITVQDTQGLKSFTPVEVGLFMAQTRSILEDMPVAAFKLGMLGSAAIAQALYTLLEAYPHIPVVVDPVLASGDGQVLVTEEMKVILKTLLIPLATVLTPNAREARSLAPEADTLNACGHALLALGCQNVLITGGDEPSVDVKNQLFSHRQKTDEFVWPRFPQQCHGTGCTLAAAIAALLAQGCDPYNAIYEAQQFTWKAIEQALYLGQGQAIPNRFYWAQKT